MGKLVSILLVVLLIITGVFTYHQVSSIKKDHGITQIEADYQNQNNYDLSNASAVQSTQVYTQVEMDMTREIGKAIVIGIEGILFILLFIALTIFAIAIKLINGKKEKPLKEQKELRSIS